MEKLWDTGEIGVRRYLKPVRRCIASPLPVSLQASEDGDAVYVAAVTKLSWLLGVLNFVTVVWQWRSLPACVP